MTKEDIVNSITLNGMRELDNDRCFQAMEECANLRLSEQKEKHDKEMEEFAEWINDSAYVFNKGVWQYTYANKQPDLTTTELLTKFKNR